MMRFLSKTWLVMIATALLQGVAAAASFTASLDREALTLGEQATLSLKFEGADTQNPPGLPAIPGLQFQYVGPSTSFSFINGQTSSSITYNYLVIPQRDGQFTIPAMRIQVGGQTLTSNPLKLTVTKPGAPSADDVNAGNEVAFLKFVLPKKQVYLGEPIVGTLELYLRDDVQNINGFQLTSSPTDGFSAGKVIEQNNQKRRVQMGQRTYTIIPLALPLTAVRTGPLTLGPFTANLGVILPGQNQGGDPFFRQFFNQGEQRQVSLGTDPFSVEVLPLPAQNRPAGFTGAVGDFTMSFSAGPTNLTVGDPITARVQISGHGALDAVTLAVPDSWQNFKAYPPTSKFEPADQYGFAGTKTFEQILTPQNSDVRELPAYTFAFFNPDDGQYHHLTQPAIPLTLHAAAANPLPATAGNRATPENANPQDILPVKEHLGTLAFAGTPLLAQPGFLALQAVPVLAFLGALVWRKRTDSLANNPRLRRQRAVAQLVATGLNDLDKFAAANRSEEFFALLFRLMQEQLGERLDVPASAITEADVDNRLVRLGASAATLESLRELFQLCNQARYAPVRGTGELNSLAAKLKPALAELQGLKP